MQESPAVRDHMKQMRIICSAIIGGVTVFAGVVYYLHSTGSFTGGDLDLPDWVGMLLNGVALALLLGAHLVRQIFSPPARPRDEEAALTWHRQTIIVGFAVREAAAFTALVGALLTGEVLGAGTMVALTYISMTMAWPRRAQIPL